MSKNTGLLFGLGAGAAVLYLLMRKRDVPGPPLPRYGRGDVLMVFIPVVNVEAYTTIIETVLEQDGTWTAYAKAGMYPDYDPPDCMHGPLADLLNEGWVYYGHIELPDTDHCPIPG